MFEKASRQLWRLRTVTQLRQQQPAIYMYTDSTHRIIVGRLENNETIRICKYILYVVLFTIMVNKDVICIFLWIKQNIFITRHRGFFSKALRLVYARAKRNHADLIPSRRASHHFCRYSFHVPLGCRGWRFIVSRTVIHPSTNRCQRKARWWALCRYHHTSNHHH